jgi:hypothetical protein
VSRSLCAVKLGRLERASGNPAAAEVACRRVLAMPARSLPAAPYRETGAGGGDPLVKSHDEARQLLLSITAP